MVVAEEMPDKCPKCGCTHLTQDPDTLDTWFSSALWPFSTLGWPKENPDLDYFYPTDVLVTGYDIIFFWVIRMVFSGLEQTGKTPFHHVLIHGLVRDSQGRKMSKSLGNGIDPLEVIDKYGADALRLTLVTGNAPGNDMRFYWEQVEASRNFANKIWNASRYIMMNLPEGDIKAPEAGELQGADKWILSELNDVIKEIQYNMESYELGIAVQKVHDFLWDEFCDWYIEMTKPRLFAKESDPRSAEVALWTLKEVLSTGMKLLHPFMPFITEEIYCTLLPEKETIMTEEWPKYDEGRHFPKDAKMIDMFKEIVRGVRGVRTEMNVPHNRKTEVFIAGKDEASVNVLTEMKASLDIMGKMLFASDISIKSDRTGIPEDAVSIVGSEFTTYIPLDELVDKEKEIDRLTKEKERIEGEIKRASGMLSNPNFVNKAPEAKVNAEKEKLEKYKGMLETIEKQLAAYLR